MLPEQIAHRSGSIAVPTHGQDIWDVVRMLVKES